MYNNILSNLVIKKVHSVLTFYSEAGRRAKRESRPYWGIIFKFEGETIYNVSEKSYISNANNMVILPKGSSYEFTCTKAGHFFAIEFDCDIEYDDILLFPVGNADKMFNLFKQAEYILTLKKPMYEAESIKILYEIIIKLVKSHSNTYYSGEKKRRLIPAIEYIARNYNKKIKNEDLARLTGLSTDYFRKIFKDVYNVSPIEFISELKIKKAKEMLKSDYESITNIAISLGYDNIYDFSRCFKKATGIPPSKYH